MIGQQKLHYKILEKLGEGGMGVVYRAEDRKLKRNVAIKFLPPQIANSGDELERFKIEAQAAAALNHPNVATIYAIEEAENETFIAMEYIEGEELKAKIQTGPLQVDEAIRIASQIGEGLKAAHLKGIVHRDIKSTNIMVTMEGQIKIMDFGLAKMRGGPQMTQIGTTLGTAAFMSPEQARGEETDQRTDIWALGIVIYEMLTGELPFKGDYEQAVIYCILNEEASPIQELRGDVPSPLIHVIEKSLAKNVEGRYQSMDELLADLEGEHDTGASSRARASQGNIEHNLPNPGTRFIGRKQEIQKIEKLQKENRLVTLYGPGGSGKTRLAVEVARTTMTDYPDGVYFFDLAPVESPDMVSDAFAEVLKVNKQKDKSLEASLARQITEKAQLLVVDNCEHLIDKCAEVIKFLLENTDRPKLIITSREVLNINAELKYYVPALTVPDRAIKVSESDQYESILLFRDRAQMSNPDFVLDEGTIDPVSSICQQLDGIPLALELAAARTNIMDTDTILKRLQNQFKLLRSSSRSEVPRQQTIRATLDWSHDLLNEDEKLLLYRLSVFAGGFDLEDVEAICSYDPLAEEDIIDLLTHLADKSLVVIAESVGGKRRYRLLELMKEYGREKLNEDETKHLKQKYCSFYSKKVKKAYLEQYEKSSMWIEWLSLEHDNIEATLEMLSSSPSEQLELVSYLGWYWQNGANHLVGQKYLAAALTQHSEEDVMRGRALCWLGNIEGWYGSDLEASIDKMDQGTALLRKHQAPVDLANTLQFQGFLYMFAGEFDIAGRLLKEGLQIAESLDNPWLILRYKTWIGGSLTNQFRADEAEQMVIENLEESRKMNALTDYDFNLHFYADLPMVREDYHEAEIRYMAGTLAGQKNGNLNLAIYDLQGVGMCLCGQGRYQKGLKLFGASIAKYESIGAAQLQNHFWNILIERTVGKTIAEIGAEAAEALIAEGRQMNFEDAIDYAADREAP